MNTLDPNRESIKELLSSGRYQEAEWLIREGQPSPITLDKLASLPQFNSDPKNFFISPGIVDEVLENNNLLYIPGAETVSEFIYLYKKGYKIIKFFPANLNGEQKKLQSIENILKDIKFIPTGGVNKDNINKYLDLKNVLCVGTSNFEEF